MPPTAACVVLLIGGYAVSTGAPFFLRCARPPEGHYISRLPVFMEGRIELLQYLQEQVVCDTYHRYGNLGESGLL